MCGWIRNFERRRDLKYGRGLLLYMKKTARQQSKRSS